MLAFGAVNTKMEEETKVEIPETPFEEEGIPTEETSEIVGE